MKDLEVTRKEIIETDKALAALFKKRMYLAKDVAAYKKANNLPILDEKREVLVRERFVNAVDDAALSAWAEKLITNMMTYSKEYQAKQLGLDAEKPQVVYQGTAGAYGEEATLGFFADGCNARNVKTFEAVFNAVEGGEAQYGVLPIENSSTGAIGDVYDLLAKRNCRIVGEYILPIRHNLMGVKGASADTIQTVYSHAQGIEQCSAYLSKFENANLVPYHNPAVSAAYVAEQADVTKAAIASKRCAELYNLKIIAENINNNKNNFTRFVVIKKDEQIAENADKISVMMTLRHESGTLAHVVSLFLEYGVNLLKIESRPIPNRSWEYCFFIDFEGNMRAENVNELVGKLMAQTTSFALLGNYKAAALKEA